MAWKSTLARKAVKTTARHGVHGAVSKLKRQPLRTTTLLVVGALLGAALVWLLGRRGGSDDGSGAAPDAGGDPGPGSGFAGVSVPGPPATGSV